ncbi:MAG TPA: response regulator [Candidatus Melainabacteria bacterium]|nr:response regulator [Candidatus Melainabacteria bacterium]HIN65811.1 response regulator [Candidatus Obscuribacterales bacterium]
MALPFFVFRKRRTVGEGDPVPVLVVEDNAHLRQAVILQLERLGLKADSAADGIEAVQRVHESEYVLILMDVQMPKMNGLEATAAIRNFEETERRRPACIVAVTGGGSTKEKCLEIGMNGYVEKPVLLEGLQELIENYAPGLLHA